VVNLILNDLVRALDPTRMDIEGSFNVRGGITTVVRATHQRGGPLPDQRDGRAAPGVEPA
jgi:NADPH-dependent 7-cyano-7-deazaguanine reductase QueF